MAGGHKPRLTEEAKDYAVLCFARFMRPSQVVEALQERFGITIDRRDAQTYDPDSVKGMKDLGKKRKAMFAQLRTSFLEELEQIPIANRAVRLQQLQLHYQQAVDKGNLRMAADLLEQASKEAGNFHSSEKTVKLTGSLKVEEVGEDEMRNTVAAAIAKALDDTRGERTHSTVQ